MTRGRPVQPDCAFASASKQRACAVRFEIFSSSDFDIEAIRDLRRAVLKRARTMPARRQLGRSQQETLRTILATGSLDLPAGLQFGVQSEVK
jgi:hypothetical protein